MSVFYSVIVIFPLRMIISEGLKYISTNQHKGCSNTFTVTSATTGSATGTVTMYTNIYVELDTFNTIGLPVLIPGEGINCPNGIFVGVGSSVTATVYYG